MAGKTIAVSRELYVEYQDGGVMLSMSVEAIKMIDFEAWLKKKSDLL